MRDRSELNGEARPEDVATAIVVAVEGGLLLAQTTRTSRPLELAVDVAIAHVARASV